MVAVHPSIPYHIIDDNRSEFTSWSKCLNDCLGYTNGIDIYNWDKNILEKCITFLYQVFQETKFTLNISKTIFTGSS